MSATTIATALKTILLATPELDNVLIHRPRTIQTSPTVYIQFQRRERMARYARKWYFRIRLCVIWQDNEGVEAEFLSLLEVIPAAIEANSTLGLPAVITSITDGEGHTLSMDGTVCRVCEYIAEVMDKSIAA